MNSHHRRLSSGWFLLLASAAYPAISIPAGHHEQPAKVSAHLLQSFPAGDFYCVFENDWQPTEGIILSAIRHEKFCPSSLLLCGPAVYPQHSASPGSTQRKAWSARWRSRHVQSCCSILPEARLSKAGAASFLKLHHSHDVAPPLHTADQWKAKLPNPLVGNYTWLRVHSPIMGDIFRTNECYHPNMSALQALRCFDCDFQQQANGAEHIRRSGSAAFSNDGDGISPFSSKSPSLLSQRVAPSRVRHLASNATQLSGPTHKAAAVHVELHAPRRVLQLQSQPQAPGHSRIFTKLYISLAIFLCGVIGGALPLLMTDREAGEGYERIMRLSIGFTGGVMLSAGLLHLLPDAEKQLGPYRRHLTGNIPVAHIALLIGLLLVIMLETVSETFDASTHHVHHSISHAHIHHEARQCELGKEGGHQDDRSSLAAGPLGAPEHNAQLLKTYSSHTLAQRMDVTSLQPSRLSFEYPQRLGGIAAGEAGTDVLHLSKPEVRFKSVGCLKTPRRDLVDTPPAKVSEDYQRLPAEAPACTSGALYRLGYGSDESVVRGCAGEDVPTTTDEHSGRPSLHVSSMPTSPTNATPSFTSIVTQEGSHAEARPGAAMPHASFPHVSSTVVSSSPLAYDSSSCSCPVAPLIAAPLSASSVYCSPHGGALSLLHAADQLVPPEHASNSPSAPNGVVSFLLLLALSFHSLMEGLALGTVSQDARLIGLAILAHKLITAFSLGTSLVKEKLGIRKFVVEMLAFAVMTPFGVLVGACLTKLWGPYGEEGGGEERLSTWGVVPGVCTALGAGTFLEVALVEVIAPEVHRCRTEQCTLRDRWSILLIWLLGCAVMGGLAVVA